MSKKVQMATQSSPQKDRMSPLPLTLAHAATRQTVPQMASQVSPRLARASSSPFTANFVANHRMSSGTGMERGMSKDGALQFVHGPSYHPPMSQGALERKLSRAFSPESPKQNRSVTPYQRSEAAHPASSPPILLRREGSLSPLQTASLFMDSNNKKQSTPQKTTLRTFLRSPDNEAQVRVVISNYMMVTDLF